MLRTASTQLDALRALKRGEAVIFPTDTLFGLGVSVNHAPSPEVLYTIKQRDVRKPIAWLVGSIDDLACYGRVVPNFAFTLARTFWPGPLTIIVRASDKVPPAFRSQEGTIGLRMPANDTARGLISMLGCPIATTSANVSGKKSARAFSDIDEEILHAVSVVLTDNQEKSGIASTIVDCTAEHPIMVREGAITIADIQALS